MIGVKGVSVGGFSFPFSFQSFVDLTGHTSLDDDDHILDIAGSDRWPWFLDCS